MAWDLVDKYGFNPNAYGKWDSGGNNRAIQYVMDGLKMQGCNPGLVVGPRGDHRRRRQALTGGADTCTVWAAFARRGLGYSAVQGGTGPQRQHRGVRHASGLPARLHQRDRRAGADHDRRQDRRIR